LISLFEHEIFLARLKKVSLNNFQLVTEETSHHALVDNSANNGPLLLKSFIKYLPNLNQLSLLRNECSLNLKL
jgi:hypothetical protein